MLAFGNKLLVLRTFSYVMTYSRFEISDRPVQLMSDVCLLWNLSTKIKKRQSSDLQEVWLKLNARHHFMNLSTHILIFWNRCAFYIRCFQPLNVNPYPASIDNVALGWFLCGQLLFAITFCWTKAHSSCLLQFVSPGEPQPLCWNNWNVEWLQTWNRERCRAASNL